MNSALISKIEKARRYADEPERVRIESFEADFHGEHADYTVTMEGDSFSDTSPGYQTHGTSAHIMAMQRLLMPMLTEEQQVAGAEEKAHPSTSTLISKIEKSRWYAQEPERVRFRSLRATIRGGHEDHNVALDGDEFRCDCHFFENYGTCSHVMALQRLLAPMLSDEQQTAGQPFSFSTSS